MKSIYHQCLLLSVLVFMLALHPAQAEWSSSFYQLLPDSTAFWQKIDGQPNQVESKPKPDFGTDEKIRADKDARFREIWNRVIPKLDEAINITEQIKIAPESALFQPDKAELSGNYEDVINSIITLLEGTNILRYRNRIERLKKQISKTQDEISRLNEARIGAPSKHWFHTTKEGYSEQIDAAVKNIEDYQLTINNTQNDFVDELNAMGLNLSIEQAKVLLARVDADDILQMMVVFDTLKYLTINLMDIMNQSGDSVDYVRYYGMYVVLLDLALIMQNQYIESIDNQYMPRLEEIIDRTFEINKESVRSLRKERSEARRRVYRSNIKAHQLTLTVSKLYIENIRRQRAQISEVKDKLEKDLALARNTFETVSVSSELLNILTVGQSSFDALMKLQVPEIVPFEDNAMLRKFEEISDKLSVRN